MLRSIGAQAKVRLKQEFRALQGVHHPNLVSLGELLEEDGELFFTMELVTGEDFIEHVRPDARPRAAREVSLPCDDLETRVARHGRPPAPAPTRWHWLERRGERFDEALFRAAFLELARGLEAWGGADLEALTHHFRDAGDVERSSAYAARAGDQAAAAPAFDRAAELYRAAHALFPRDRVERRDLLIWFLGDSMKMRRRIPLLARESDARGDRYISLYVRANVGNATWLFADEADAAEREIDAACAGWTGTTFDAHGLCDLVARTSLALYRGMSRKATSWMEGQGIVSPERVTALLAPGLTA